MFSVYFLLFPSFKSYFWVFLICSSIRECRLRMLSYFFSNSVRTKASIFSYLALNYCLSLFCFSRLILSLISKFFFISSWAFILSSCSYISRLTVSEILFSSLFWNSPCRFFINPWTSSPILSFCAISWLMISLSFILYLPKIAKLFSAVCSLSITLSPNSLNTSFPFMLLWPMSARFFSALTSL